MELLKALFAGNELENKVAFKRMQIIAAGMMAVNPMLEQMTGTITQLTNVVQALLMLFTIITTVATTKSLGLKKV